MRRTHTNTHRTLRSRFAAMTVACLVLTLAKDFAVPTVAIAASTFKPSLLVNTEAFLVIDDDDTTADVVMRFGDTLLKTLTFNRSLDRFEFNDDLYVSGLLAAPTVSATNTLTSSGSLVWEGAGSGSSLDLAGGNVTVSRSGATFFNLGRKDVDFGVFGKTNNSLFYVNASGSGTAATASGGVGIGTRTPVTQLHVAGRMPTKHQGTWSVGTGPYDVEVQGKILYTIDGSGNLKTADVSNASSPVSLGSLSGLGSPTDLVVQGGYAYVSTSLYVKIIDVSNPKSPTVVGTTPSVPGAANYMAVSGPYLYLGDATNTLTTFDISNPTAPVKTSTATSGGRFAVDGTYLYTIDNGTFKIFSLKDPATPVQVSSTTVTNGTSIAVQGRYAYIGRYSSSAVSVVDVSDPSTPVSVGSVTVTSNPNQIAVQGRYAYVSDLFSKFSIVDVSNPVSPSLLGTVSSGGSTAVGITVAGRYAYVANRDSSTVTVFDLGGAYVQQLEAGGAEFGTLQLRNNLTATDGTFRGAISAMRMYIAGNGAFSGSLKLGHGLSTSSGNIVFSRTGSVVFNEQSRPVDFRIEGDTDPNAFVVDASTDRIGIGTATPKAKLNVVGILSGVTLYATRSFSGAGLTDCDNATNSKLLWDATTGRFSCGTDQSGGSSGGGLAISDADKRYVNAHGDTMTGRLLLNRTMLDVRGSGSFVAHDYSDHVLVVTATGSQQGDLQQWRGDSNSSTPSYVRVTNVGDLVVNTNAAFGDSSSDTVTFYGGVTSDFVPYYNSSYNIGNSSNWWYSGYFNGMNVYGQANVNSLSISSVQNCNSGYVLVTDSSGNVYCEYGSAGSSSSSGYFGITDGSSTEYIYDYENISFNAGQNINVSVSSTDTVTIGTTDDVSFVNMNVGGNTTLGDSSSDSVTFGAMIASSLLPWSNVTYDLGNTSARWNTGYFRSMDLEGNGAQLIVYNTQDELIPQIIAKSVSSEASIVLRNNDSSSDSVVLSSYHDDAQLMNVENGTLRFGTNNTSRMVIDQLGNVSIGGDFVGFGSQANKAKLSVSGTLSGVTVYATRSFSGAGLTDCDNATNSKLLWDATTGRFSCGTDQSGGGSSGGGLGLSDADARYVNVGGDTMTGALRIAVNGGNTNTLSLRVGGVMSGANLVVTGTGANPLLTTDTTKPAVRIGGSGMLLLGGRNDPGTAPANTTALYGTSIAGKTMPAAREGSSGWAASPLQASLFGNLIMSITTGAGTTVNGYGTTVVSDTTVSHPTADQTYGYMTNFATAASSGDEAGTSSANTAWFRGSTTGANGFFYYARVGTVDTTSIRVFSGMADQTIATMVGGDNPSGNYAGFQFSTNRSDTSWQFVTKNGTTQNVVNTGLAFSASKVYDLAFFCQKQCSVITWEIRNVTDGTSATGVTSSNLPTTNTGLRLVLGVETLTSAAKNIRMQQIYVEADR